MNRDKLLIIAGPCMIEDENMTMKVAEQLKTICHKNNVDLIFKSSFDKANRTSVNSARGVGIDKGKEIFKKIKNELSVKIITDVHESWQCKEISKVVDYIQIPAFLCRQTDLLKAAAETGLPVNVKKGQFLAPWDMKNVIKKLEEFNTKEILITERGTSFGYNSLVVDFTSFHYLSQFGKRVVFDATHSVQKPGGNGESTGGNRNLVPKLIYSAIASGVDAIFMEVHPDPDNALSDGPNQIKLKDFSKIIENANSIFKLVSRLIK